MKILHTVESYFPSVGGMQKVVQELSERMVVKGHDVTVATSKHNKRSEHNINGVVIKEFDISGNSVKGIQGRDIEKYIEYIKQFEGDVIVNFAATQWATDLTLPHLSNIKVKKISVPTGFSNLFNKEYSSYFHDYITYAKEYDGHILLSNTYVDTTFLREHNVKNMYIVPNGASELEFEKNKKSFDIRKFFNIPKNHLILLNVSNHTGIKGHRELYTLYSKIDNDNTTLIQISDPGIKGRCYPECFIRNKVFNLSHKNKTVISTSLTREQLIDTFFQADLFVFTSNLECSPLVLFECMASGLPFVTTDVGNAKEICEWSESGILLPTHKRNSIQGNVIIKPAVEIINNILREKETLKEMSRKGRYYWKNRFTWDTITDEYLKIYNL